MFTAYYEKSPGLYQERFGIPYEKIEPGQRFIHRPGITFSQQENIADTMGTLNAAMLHYDRLYAEATTWGQELMVSTWTLQRLIGMTWKTFGTYRKRIVSFTHITMKGPVFGGDTIYAETEVLAKASPAEPAQLTLLTHGYNQRNEHIASVEYVIEMWKESDLPELLRINGSPALDTRFLSHRSEGNNTYTEQVGLFFEDLKEGETFIHAPRRTVQKSDLAERAYNAMDWSPANHDLAWQRAAGIAEDTAPQSWLVGLVATLSTRTLGRVVANLGWTGVQIHSDVHVGETVESRSTITGTRLSASRPNEGIVTVNTMAITDDERKILEFTRTLLVYRKEGDTPYAAAKY